MLYPQYVSITPNFLTEEEVKTLNSWFKMYAPEHNARVGGLNDYQDDPDAPPEEQEGGSYDTSIRKSEIRWGDLQEIGQMHPDIVDKVMNGIYQKACEMGMQFSIEFAENMQHTTYHAPEKKEDVAGFYTWHTDAGPNIDPNQTIRKLSAIIQLTDPDEYEGGHFQWLEPWSVFDKLRSNNTTVRMDDAIITAPFSAKTKGTLIVFPSYVHHQVTPVTRGTRQSLVLWQQGYPHA
jgi:hypothetical protein